MVTESAASTATADELARGIAELGLAVDSEQRRRLLAFVDLICKWSRAYNLTAVRDPELMVSRHLLDSLSIAPYLHGDRLLDVGTGAGLPGIPLAIAFPARQVVLLDSNGKKTRFCIHAAAELGLSNVAVEQARVEDYRPARAFDTVMSRAFAGLAAFAAAAGHLLAPDGLLLAMQGRTPAEPAAPVGFRVAAVAPVTVPGLLAERHVVTLKRSDGAVHG